MAVHSRDYLKIKRHYETGLWSRDRVYNTVNVIGGITPAEYEKITGEAYTV